MNAKDEDGLTALIYAVSMGHVEVVQQLLQAGADVNAKEKEGRTALTLAKEKGHKEVIKMLKKAGAKE